MNILLLNRNFSIGGGSTYIHELCGALKKRGHDITIAAWFTREPEWVTKCCDRVYRIPLLLQWENRLLHHIIRKHNIDIVSTHSTKPAHIAVPVCRNLIVPLVPTMHGQVYDKRLELMYHVYENSQAVVVLNEANVRYYRSIGLPKEKVILSRLVLDWPQTNPRPPHKARVYAYCSRLSSLKGPRAEQWLRGVSLLQDAKALRVYVFGDGPYKRKLKKLGSELGLDVHLFGAVPEASRYFTDIDVLAGAGYVAMEGLRAGCAVVGIGFQGCIGAVTRQTLAKALNDNFGDTSPEHGDTSPTAIARALQEAANIFETGEASTLSEIARLECSSETVGEQMERVYSAIVNGKSPYPYSVKLQALA